MISQPGMQFFSKRVVSVWNSLPNAIVTAPTVPSFERRLAPYELTKFSRFWLLCFDFFIVWALVGGGLPPSSRLLMIVLVHYNFVAFESNKLIGWLIDFEQLCM